MNETHTDGNSSPADDDEYEPVSCSNSTNQEIGGQFENEVSVPSITIIQSDAPREENEESNIIMISTQININCHPSDSRNTDINSIISFILTKRKLPIDKCKAIKKTNPRQQMPINLTHQFPVAFDE